MVLARGRNSYPNSPIALPIRYSSRTLALSTLALALAASVHRPCFHFEAATADLPSDVFGPVLRPPWREQRGFPFIAGFRQSLPGFPRSCAPHWRARVWSLLPGSTRPLGSLAILSAIFSGSYVIFHENGMLFPRDAYSGWLPSGAPSRPQCLAIIIP